MLELHNLREALRSRFLGQPIPGAAEAFVAHFAENLLTTW
jgi:hypothetical protein